MNSKCLRCKHNRNTLHDRSTIHVNGSSQRDRKGRNLFGNTHFLMQRIDGKRYCCIGCCRGKSKSHNREKFLDKSDRIQAGKYLEQNLIHSKALDCQRDQYRNHILCQRNKRTEANIGKGSCNKTEYTDWCQTHNHHGHFHHNVIKLADKVGNHLCALSKLGKDHTNDQGKYDYLKHLAICQSFKRIVRNNIQNGLCQ
ncbi:unknown [Ruminococcus sp. CAG:60]|nr:unknown [Ruminococcus sp. CAG:60]